MAPEEKDGVISTRLCPSSISRDEVQWLQARWCCAQRQCMHISWEASQLGKEARWQPQETVAR